MTESGGRSHPDMSGCRRDSAIRKDSPEEDREDGSIKDSYNLMMMHYDEGMI